MRQNHSSPRLVTMRGFSLVEVMVAIAIGTFLLAGTLVVFGQIRSQYRTLEAVARLQENLRYAMSVVETDLRMAGYWGLHSDSSAVTPDSGFGTAALCSTDVAITSSNLRRVILGMDGSGAQVYLASPSGSCQPCFASGASDCETSGQAQQSGTDVLVIRRASKDPLTGTLTEGQLKVQSSRGASRIFSSATVPSSFSEETSTYAFMTNAYYVGTRSDADPRTPSLRRKVLGVSSGKPAVLDEEIIPGIDDFQVEYGVDTSGDGVADELLRGDELAAGDSITSARVTLSARAERREPGLPGDGYRRATLSKTVELRNTRR